MFRNKVSGIRWVESKVQILLRGSKGAKGSYEQNTKTHGLLITKVGGCTSGEKHYFQWYMDTKLEKTGSHNKKLFLFQIFFYSSDIIKEEVSIGTSMSS